MCFTAERLTDLGKAVMDTAERLAMRSRALLSQSKGRPDSTGRGESADAHGQVAAKEAAERSGQLHPSARVG
ncbi:hypothetical protein GCM10010191_20620 [Actinomadura vinacea]|uniref:CsbD family protein n=1 Tax=Actinomadura vinacea TaxID=115336 RepID=A0ABN3IS74_9ACTN